MGKQASASSTSPALQRQYGAVTEIDNQRDQVSILPPLPQLLDSDTDTK